MRGERSLRALYFSAILCYNKFRFESDRNFKCRDKKMNAVIQISETAVRYRVPIACWFLFMCAVTFIFYAADKSSAKKGTRRIKESTLLILSFIGGSAGAFAAMHILRHKTGKVKFMIGVPLSLLLHAAMTLTAVYFGSPV